METSRPIKINNQLIYGRDKTWLTSLHQTPDQLTLTIEIDLEEESSLLKMILKASFSTHQRNSIPTKKANGVQVG